MKIAHISLADWNEAVTGMTLEEEGFYWRMTRLLYSTPSGTISDDDPEVAKLMNVGVRVYRRLKAKMLGWHKETVAVVDGKITNDRVVEEIIKFCDAKKAAVARGQAGAAKRWGRQDQGSLPEVSAKFAGSLPEVSPKLGPNFDTEPNEINGLPIATPTPTPSIDRKDSPLPPSRGDDHRVISASASKAGINPYRERDPFKFNPDLDPQVVGAGYSPEGNLQLFNGAKQAGLKYAGTEEQLERDLLSIQGSGKVGPSMNLHVLKSKVLGSLAERADQRIQSDRRYREACADRRGSGRGAAPAKPKLAIDDLPPTTDPAEVERRYEMFLDEKPKYRGEREKWWPAFQDMQAKRAREAGLIQ